MLAGLLAGLVAVGGLAAWRLDSGPVPLDFLTPHLESALNAQARGFEIDIDETLAVWAGWRNAIDIRATNVTVTSPEGEPVARIPELSLGLSLRALFRGRLAPTSLDALGPSVRVVRGATGEFLLGFTLARKSGDKSLGTGGEEIDIPSAPEASGNKVVRFLVDRLLAEPDPENSFGYLRRVSILDARMVFEDRMAGRYFWAPGAEIVLLRSGDGVIGDARLNLEYGDRQAGFRIRANINGEAYATTAELSFTDLEPAAFAASLPQFELLSALKVPLAGRFLLAGTLESPAEMLEFDLFGGRGTIELPKFYDAPLNIEALNLRGTAGDQLRDIVLEKASIEFGGPRIDAKGTIRSEAGESAIAVSARLQGMPMERLDRYWPGTLAPKARTWVTTNIGGSADEATIDIAFLYDRGAPKPFKVESLGGTLIYSGLSIDYFKPMPPVTDIKGRGTYDSDGFYLGVESGRIGDGIAVTGGQVDLIGLSTLKTKGPSRIDIKMLTEGRVRAVMEVIDHEPLFLAHKIGLDPAQLDGTITGTLGFEFPLIAGLTTDHLNISATAQIRDAAVSDGPFGLDVTEGALALTLTQDRVDISGNTRINGVPAAIRWAENLKGQGDYLRRIDAKAKIDAVQRKALGLPDLSWWLAGVVDTGLTYTVPLKGVDRLAVDADLTPALVRVPEIGWRKKAGTVGRLVVDGTVAADQTLIFEKFHLTTPDMDGLVWMEFLPDLSDIVRMTIQHARYGGNDVQGEITLMPEGGYRIDVNGPRMDVRHFLSDDAAEQAGVPNYDTADMTPFRVKARFDEAVTGPGRSIHDASMTGRYNGRDWVALRLRATLGQGANLTVNYGKATAGYDLKVRSSDAGQALRSLDWSDEIAGGSLVINGHRKTVDAPITGTFTVKDYRMVEAPAGLKFLQVMTLVGLPAAVGEKGVSFVSMDGSYIYDYHKDLLTLGDIESYGSSLGIRVDKGGWLDFDKQTVDVQGVVIPANVAQKVLGSIPLLGTILTGGEALVAANFRISGSLDEPSVTVNPLSVLPLPGFLRKLFRAPVKEGEARAPSRSE